MATSRKRSRTPVVPLAFVAIIAIGIIAFVATTRPSSDAADAAFGDPVLEGEPLPVHRGEPHTDPAIGMTAPSFSGPGHDGQERSVAWDGTPRLLFFLAHWCPACQAEVPWVQEAIDDGAVPDGIEVVAVTTWTDDSRPEFPPQDWLEGEGWTVPTIADGEDFRLAEAYGMHSTPFWVLVDGEGTVIARLPGGAPEEQFRPLLEEFASDTGV